MVSKMTYYFINPMGLLQQKVGGDPPDTNIFVAVSPDGMMRKFENGRLLATVPIPNNDLKDIIERKNALTLLGVSNTIRKRGKKSKPKSKRKKCRCK